LGSDIVTRTTALRIRACRRRAAHRRRALRLQRGRKRRRDFVPSRAANVPPPRLPRPDAICSN